MDNLAAKKRKKTIDKFQFIIFLINIKWKIISNDF